jgi:cytochrome c peroxidase
MIHSLALAVAVSVFVSGAGSVALAHPGHRYAPEPAVRAAEPATFDRSERFDFDPPTPGTYRLPVIGPAADGVVVDASGAPRQLRGILDGKIALLSFIYTRCSDGNGCPLAAAVLYRLHQASAEQPALARNLKLVSLSLDPGHDTPAVMGRYGALARKTGSPWEFLTTRSERELVPILRAYGQTIDRPADPVGGPTHLLRVYLIDRQQRIRNIYGLDFLDARLLISDVRTLLLEERGETP